MKNQQLEREHEARKRVLERREDIKTSIADCVADLHKAVLDAGGDPRGMLDMTLREFVTSVAAQNEIRFVHWPTYLRQHTDETGDPEMDALLAGYEENAKRDAATADEG